MWDRGAADPKAGADPDIDQYGIHLFRGCSHDYCRDADRAQGQTEKGDYHREGCVSSAGGNGISGVYTCDCFDHACTSLFWRRRSVLLSDGSRLVCDRLHYFWFEMYDGKVSHSFVP